MKKILLVILIIISFVSCRKNSENIKKVDDNKSVETVSVSHHEDIYDVVIVGGGMAGLSAAYHLNKIDKNLKMIILEKDNRVGGRIFNKKINDVDYSIGAAMGYHKMMIPVELKDKCHFVSQDAPKGVYFNDKLSLKNTSEEAFNELTGGKVPLNSYKFLNFIVHLERMSNSAQDLFYKPDEYCENFDLVSYYESLLSEHISLNSDVTSIESKGDSVEIVYKKKGEEFKILSKAVVVATPATVAKKIIRNLPENTLRFLNSVKYSKTKILSLVYKRTNDLVPFSYIDMEPKYDFWKMDRYFLNNPNYAFYNIASDKLIDLKDKDFLEKSLDFLNKLGIGNFKKENILKYEIIVWDEMVTNYCEDYSTDCEMSFLSQPDICNGAIDTCIKNPLDRVFFAGDYTLLYGGVFTAWLSGRNAANRAGRSLGFKTGLSDISVKKK